MTDDVKLKLIDAFDRGRTPTERMANAAAIAQTPEAIAFVRKLESDRQRLVQTQRSSAPKKIAAKVAQSIEPVVTTSRPVPNVQRSWLPWAMAASVMLAVSVGTFLILTRDRQDQTPSVVKVAPLPASVSSEPKPSNDSPIANAVKREELPLPGTRVAEKTPTPSPGNLVDTNDEQRWLAARVIPELPPLALVSPKLPFLISANDWTNADAQTRLAQELTKAPASRVDLFAKDTPKIIDQLTGMLKANGVNLTVASPTAEQLKRKLNGVYVIYCESLSAEDWSGLFKKWNAAETIHSAHVMSAGPAEARELKSLLGIDPGLAKRPRDDAKNAPISDGTLNQVTQAIQKSKSALLTTAGPNVMKVNPNAVTEIKAFMDRRGERPQKAIPVMIVIRSVN